MKRPLLLVALAGVGCGGRAIGPRDGGGSNLDASADRDADADVDAGDGLPRVFCDDGVEQCPSEQPYCCGYEVHVCGSEPFEEPHWEGQWECLEKADPDTIVGSDCADLGAFREEDCPEGFSHCCSYLGGGVCADHILVGWRCDE